MRAARRLPGEGHAAANGEAGFSLIELLVAIGILGIVAAIAIPAYRGYIDTAEAVTVVAQAKMLSDKDRRNVMNCEAGEFPCIDITSTGVEACEQAIADFFPELDLSKWQVRNIPSDTPPDEWNDYISQGEAVYTVTRFQGDDTENHPDPGWFEDWNARAPCILSKP